MAEMNISGIYKITNTITGDFYIGSSKDVKHRWSAHKCPSVWKRCSNNPMYLDMQKYGLDIFSFEILEEVEIASLKEKEQWFIKTLKPTYNNINAKGLDVDRQKEYRKEYQKKYCKEYHRKYNKEYKNQLCLYNGKVLTLNALYLRFYKDGIKNPTLEAKKYILTNCKVK